MRSSKKYFLTLKFIKLKYLFLVFLFSVFISEKSYSLGIPNSFISSDDSVKKLINKDANRASLLSMILPGLGQAYNHKYWKIPIIYAALGGIGYLFLARNQEYQDYHNELLFRYANPNASPNSFSNYSLDQINTQKVQAKKYRDFCIIGMGMIYLINVIDANVGAHLKTFDVSDNLSLSIKPKAFYCSKSPYGLAGGISLALNFK